MGEILTDKMNHVMIKPVYVIVKSKLNNFYWTKQHSVSHPNKHSGGSMRTTKAQISLRIRAV